VPSHGRREGIKIVGPLDQNREKELIGGLKNALERGEKIERAKQTFLNAGYSPKEVAMAIKKLPATTPILAPTKDKASLGKPGEKPPAKLLPASSTTPKKKSKLLLIIIIIISALVLIGAGLLGLFWNSLFGG